MIAYHFPPISGSSGMQRTLKFCQYLGNFGWTPTVLTIAPGAYPATSDAQLDDVPTSVRVVRCKGFDASRRFSIAGRYPQLAVTPDRWLSWYRDAIRQAQRLLRHERFDAIWTTYPIATAQLIGQRLQSLSGLPWVADLRDPMTDDVYPPPGLQRRSFRWIERRVVQRASRITFTAPGSLAMYRARYPEIPVERWSLIPNGYDEGNFAFADTRRREHTQSGPFTLLHSGTVYPSERDPSALFRSLAALKQARRIDASSLRIVFRATGHDDIIKPMLDAADIADLVTLAPSLPYHDALAEMMDVDASLLLQASNCNHQIPAKLYEYLRAGRPVLCLADPASDTAAALRAAGGKFVARIDDAAEITDTLMRFTASVRNGDTGGFHNAYVSSCSRYERTRELASLLDEVATDLGMQP